MSAFVTYSNTSNRHSDSEKITLDKILQTENGGGSGVSESLLTSVAITNTTWVSKDGNDTTGLRNRIDKPFLTLTAAKAASVAGDCIFVGPGTYNETDLLKHLVNWFFMPGAVVHYTTQTGVDAAIFDDNAAAVTCSIDGFGEFIFAGDQSANFPAETYLGQIVWLKHASSKLHFRAKRCANTDAVHTSDPPGLIVLTECSYFFGEIDLLEDNVVVGSSGIIWQSGNAEIYVKRISIYFYPILVAEISTGTATKCSIRAERIESLNFNPVVSLTSPLGGPGSFIFNLTAQEALNKDNHTISGGLALDTGTSFISIGRFLQNDNADVPRPAINCTGGTHSVVIGRIKNTLTDNTTAGIFARVTGGTLDLTCPVLEASGNFTGDGIVVSGGVFNYHGFGRLVMSGVGVGVLHSGGTTNLRGLRIDTTAQNNAACRAVTVSAAGLRAHQCMFVVPALALESVHAAAAQTVTFKDCASNVAKHANVTVAGEALLVAAAFV